MYTVVVGLTLRCFAIHGLSRLLAWEYEQIDHVDVLRPRGPLADAPSVKQLRHRHPTALNGTRTASTRDATQYRQIPRCISMQTAYIATGI